MNAATLQKLEEIRDRLEGETLDTSDTLEEAQKYKTSKQAYMAGVKFAEANSGSGTMTRERIRKDMGDTRRIITKMISSIGGDFGSGGQMKTDTIVGYVYHLWFLAGVLESI